MNEEIKKLILELIDKAHEKDNLRGINAQRERLANDLLSKRRYELRKDKVTNQNGVLQDLESDVNLLIDAADYIPRPTNAADKARYISKFERPSTETKKKLAAEVEGVLKKLSKMHSIVPKDQDNFDRALSVLAKNFLYEISDNDEIEGYDGKVRPSSGEVLFSKLNDNGLTASNRYTFQDLMNGFSHLIDSDRTRFASELRESELKAMARKLLDIPNPKPEYVNEKLAFIKKNELLSTIPAKRLPRISRTEIEKEIMRREVAIRGMGDLDKVISGGGTPLSLLTKISKQEYNSLNDTADIQKQLQAIQPQGPGTFEGISYE